ncbi:hypothetical protein CEXT_143331 [Caerostris extrusa]|uniref:Uncharacterized protein n=1 Tax=Caerostris extrusa TaxID=172846 RepID=A0AAV4QKY9_CAEEX|nr:hypothetical protein CEXT_143331 [Caerostris extrusa]
MRQDLPSFPIISKYLANKTSEQPLVPYTHSSFGALKCVICRNCKAHLLRCLEGNSQDSARLMRDDGFGEDCLLYVVRLLYS